MKLIDQLMEIDAAINGDGGINFLKIRAVLDDIDRLISEGDDSAIQFSNSMRHVYRLVRAAVREKSE